MSLYCPIADCVLDDDLKEDSSPVKMLSEICSVNTTMQPHFLSLPVCDFPDDSVEERVLQASTTSNSLDGKLEVRLKQILA